MHSHGRVMLDNLAALFIIIIIIILLLSAGNHKNMLGWLK